jgi:hypothetical protein
MSRVLVTTDGVWIEFITPYTFTQYGTTGNTALMLFYTLSSSPLYTHQDSESLLVVSWQRIYNSLTVTSNNTWSLLLTAQLLSCPYSASANSKDSTQFNYSYLGGLVSRSSTLHFRLDYSVSNTSSRLLCPFINSLFQTHGKHRLLLLRIRVYLSVT